MLLPGRGTIAIRLANPFFLLSLFHPLPRPAAAQAGGRRIDVWWGARAWNRAGVTGWAEWRCHLTQPVEHRTWPQLTGQAGAAAACTYSPCIACTYLMLVALLWQCSACREHVMQIDRQVDGHQPKRKQNRHEGSLLRQGCQRRCCRQGHAVRLLRPFEFIAVTNELAHLLGMPAAEGLERRGHRNQRHTGQVSS